MSLAAISELVDGLSIGCDRVEIQRAFAVRDKLDARIADVVGDYEAAGLHELDGAVTITGWLRVQAGRDHRCAAKLGSTAHKLRALPVLRAAVLDGRLTGSQLDIVLANVPDRHLARFVEHEAAVIPMLEPLSADGTRVVMEDWKRKADAFDERPPRQYDNEVRLSKTLDARAELRGSFDADLTAVVEAALRVADPKDFELPMPVRRAHALGQVCQHFLDHQHVRTGGRHRPHLNVRISYEELCEGIGGTYVDTDQPVSPAALGVLRCDSACHRLLMSGASGILDYGRATRAWPVDIYNAIVLRDGGCRVGGCQAPASWCDVHHVLPWEDGGTTEVANGILACRRHHHLLHKPGYELKLLPDGTTKLTLPDGRVEVDPPWRRSPGGS